MCASGSRTNSTRKRKPPYSSANVQLLLVAAAVPLPPMPLPLPAHVGMTRVWPYTTGPSRATIVTSSVATFRSAVSPNTGRACPLPLAPAAMPP